MRELLLTMHGSAEKAKAMQRSDSALRLDLVHRFEPGPDVHAEAKQPRDISENKMGLEPQFRGHLVSYQQLVHAVSNMAVRTPARAVAAVAGSRRNSAVRGSAISREVARV
jgi:hypothetical protein